MHIRIGAIQLLTLAVAVVIAVDTGWSKGAAERPADTVYFGGPILTMEGDSAQYAEAIAVQGGKILFVGGKDGALALQADSTRMVDLKGRTMLPGFIDAHGHVWNAGFQKLAANLLPPPDGKGTDIVALVGILKNWAANNSKAISKVGWIIGFGYDAPASQLMASGRRDRESE